MLAEGKLPHLAALREQGCFKPLGTTLPPISPVAWSSFQTGVNPGKHNIFDFLTPTSRTYQPKLSSVEIRPPRRSLRLGKYRIPLGKADVRLLRKSQPFWNSSSDYGIFSCIIRVPITFPPEKLRGVLLSAMCVPDLRGTQGMFSLLHDPAAARGREDRRRGPSRHARRQHRPRRPDRPATTRSRRRAATLKVAVRRHDQGRGPRRPQDRRRRSTNCGRTSTPTGSGSRFRVVPGHEGARRVQVPAAGSRARVRAVRHADQHRPGKPGDADRLSRRSIRVYLAKRQGPFATLGLAEDTWALNEHVLNDEHFIQQCLDIDREREAMFFDGLDKVPRGLCVVRLRRHRPPAAHVLARHRRRRIPARAEHPGPGRPQRHRGPLPAHGRPGRPDDGEMPGRRTRC